MKRLIAAIALIIGLPTAFALADFAGTAGSGLTFFSFTCFTSKLCTAQVPINSAGTEIGTSGAPIRIDPTGTTPQPVSGTVTANLGTIGAAATAANQATEISSLATIATNTGAAIPAGTATIGTVGQLPYPVGATPYTATATGTTAATTATLAGASSVTTYLCGFSIRANATAAATGNATVTGVITATLNFTQWTAPNASGLGITEMIFAPCIPASGTNQSVAVVSAAPGTGGVVSVTAWGYKL